MLLLNMNDITSDYKIVIIDSKNVFYNNTDNNYDFYIIFPEPLKDVYKIKILYDAVSILTSNLIDPIKTNNLDNIYIKLNDYDRVRTSLIVDVTREHYDNKTLQTTQITTKELNTLNYFDSIMIDLNKIKSNQDINETTMFNDFNENQGDYFLKPIASQLNRINIQLLDKNNIIISKSYIIRFVMKLCIYYNTKKISQF